MFKSLRNPAARVRALALAAPLAVVSAASHASGGGVDVSSVTSAIGGASTPIAAIGAAVLVVLVGIKVYKWIARAM